MNDLRLRLIFVILLTSQLRLIKRLPGLLRDFKEYFNAILLVIVTGLFINH